MKLNSDETTDNQTKIIDEEFLPKPQAIKRQKAEMTTVQVNETDHSELFLRMLSQQLNEKNS